MSGCNCKSGDISNITSGNNKITWKKVVEYFVRFFGVLLFITILPILNLYFIWVIFKSLMLNKSFNIYQLLDYVKKMQKQEEDYDDYDDEDDDDEIELTEFEVIKKEK